ncbi:hypothetical protein PTSG_07588 [Salpingoeca rosetta]|uniref:Uncharacterized protein n=1 Tax=Salpingoeca rosetta (strain ATCC 50818 / BSB-021) TaxID=946362 RepID=F2UH74_SALR5|nr:uncharacterized protein PTSG_07588 [Salpingoeca rosetta]EGD76472.1 hypothetical protein PTSG_07588 [Salpingoeca rosetta]|eukprot:XP_004991386.1 hypothetical protein PTSG_07588 [Salpingoeca rosetta]
MRQASRVSRASEYDHAPAKAFRVVGTAHGTAHARVDPQRQEDTAATATVSGGGISRRRRWCYEKPFIIVSSSAHILLSHGITEDTQTTAAAAAAARTMAHPSRGCKCLATPSSDEADGSSLLFVRVCVCGGGGGHARAYVCVCVCTWMRWIEEGGAPLSGIRRLRVCGDGCALGTNGACCVRRARWVVGLCYFTTLSGCSLSSNS